MSLHQDEGHQVCFSLGASGAQLLFMTSSASGLGVRWHILTHKHRATICFARGACSEALYLAGIGTKVGRFLDRICISWVIYLIRGNGNDLFLYGQAEN